MADRPPAAKLGLIGVAGAGKTSLFCALTGTDYARAVAASGKAIGGSVRVEDPRLVRIHQVEGSHKKLVAPTLEIFDAPSIALSGPEKQDNPGTLAHVRDNDGFVVLLKAYDLEGDRRAQAGAQFEAIRSELFLADLDIMQKRIEKLEGDVKRALPNREELQKELATLKRLVEAISGGDTKVFDHLKEDEEKRLRGFQFFSKKPLIPMVNIGEADLSVRFEGMIAVCLKLETELLAMDEAERSEFMKDYGMTKLVLTELPVELFDRAGQEMFVTVGDKDVTGWSLRKGGTAYDAAGRIHTDIQKGFINCEVVSFAEWEKHKDYHEAQARGQKRVEGKAHVLKPFDFINIKTSG